jgi:hypothetical protein
MEQSLSPDGLSKRVISRSVISLLSATRKFRVIFRIAATSGRMGCNEDCEGWDDDDRRRSTCGGPELRVGSKPLQCDQSRSRPHNAGAIRGNTHWRNRNRHRACDSQSWQQSRPIQPLSWVLGGWSAIRKLRAVISVSPVIRQQPPIRSPPGSRSGSFQPSFGAWIR